MNISICISTQLVDIHAELFPSQAPLTVANFLRYVDAGYYTCPENFRTTSPSTEMGQNFSGELYHGGNFWRTVTLDPDNQPDSEIKIEVIQATVRADKAEALFEPLELERTTLTGLHHLDGTISMARFAPDSAQADFFICINDQPTLDFGGMRNPDGQGFAAFGKVTSGMDVVQAINKSALKEQTLTPPILIQSISRSRT